MTSWCLSLDFTSRPRPHIYEYCHWGFWSCLYSYHYLYPLQLCSISRPSILKTLPYSLLHVVKISVLHIIFLRWFYLHFLNRIKGGSLKGLSEWTKTTIWYSVNMNSAIYYSFYIYICIYIIYVYILYMYIYILYIINSLKMNLFVQLLAT